MLLLSNPFFSWHAIGSMKSTVINNNVTYQGLKSGPQCRNLSAKTQLFIVIEHIMNHDPLLDR